MPDINYHLFVHLLPINHHHLNFIFSISASFVPTGTDLTSGLLEEAGHE